MLGFAARFGGIGVRVWTWSKGVKDRSANGSREPYRLVPGEDQENWQDEILSMRAAVRIWDAVTARRFKSVRLHFATPVYVGGPLGGRPVPTTIRDIPQESIIGVGEADDDLPEHFFWTKYMPPYRAPIPGPTIESKEDGWRLLVRMANHRLREHCSPVLVERGAEVDSLALRLSPKNLIGAMWWQFSRTLIGEASYRRCKVCSRLIELSGDYGFRADRELCSSACKFKDHRRKVKEAKRMRERRKTVAQIAKHFDTTTDTIKNWLTKKK
jgi:hypothetical protein